MFFAGISYVDRAFLANAKVQRTYRFASPGFGGNYFWAAGNLIDVIVIKKGPGENVWAGIVEECVEVVHGKVDDHNPFYHILTLRLSREQVAKMDRAKDEGELNFVYRLWPEPSILDKFRDWISGPFQRKVTMEGFVTNSLQN